MAPTTNNLLLSTKNEWYHQLSTFSNKPIKKATFMNNKTLLKGPVMDFLPSPCHWQLETTTKTKNVLLPLNTAEKVDVNIKVSQRMQQKVGPELFQKMSSTNIGDLYKDKYK
jgi:hypothetical protein